MKDVISVDELLASLESYSHEALTPKEIMLINADLRELKTSLHSLLISKLPEKMVRSEVFEGESDGTIEAYNSAIDDMHRVIDEMFEVHNEK